MGVPRDRLHDTLLMLNLLNVGETGSTAAEKHRILESNAKLDQPSLLYDVLTSE